MNQSYPTTRLILAGHLIEQPNLDIYG